MISRGESVAVDTLSFVDPEANEGVRLLDRFGFGYKQSLENVCQMPHVEFVVEVERCLSEVSLDFAMERKGRLDYSSHVLLDG